METTQHRQNNRNSNSKKICGGANPWYVAFWVTSAILGITAFCLTTVYLYIYGYKNPDPLQAFVVKDLETTEKTAILAVQRANAMGVAVTQGYPLEMHKVFTRWFKWGFYAHIIFAGVALLNHWFLICSRKAYKILTTITVASFSVFLLVWGYFGTLKRFSKGGLVAAGDYLEQPEDEEVSDELWEQQLEASS